MDEPEAKKSKEGSEGKVANELELSDLSSFHLKRVLNENSERKEIFLEGRFPSRDEATPAVLILGKPPFASEALPSLLNEGTKLEKTFRNDVYYKFDAMPDPRINLLKAQGCYYVFWLKVAFSYVLFCTTVHYLEGFHLLFFSILYSFSHCCML